MKSIKSLLGAVLLYCAGAVAHSLGTGVVELHLYTFLILSIISVALSILIRDSLQGPKLALAICLSQSTFHFVINSEATNQARMVLAHVIIGTTTYFLLSNLEFGKKWLFQLAKDFITKIYNSFRPLRIVELLQSIILEAPGKLILLNINLYSIVLRAPPVN